MVYATGKPRIDRRVGHTDSTNVAPDQPVPQLPHRNDATVGRIQGLQRPAPNTSTAGCVFKHPGEVSRVVPVGEHRAFQSYLPNRFTLYLLDDIYITIRT